VLLLATSSTNQDFVERGQPNYNASLPRPPYCTPYARSTQYTSPAQPHKLGKAFDRVAPSLSPSFVTAGKVSRSHQAEESSNSRSGSPTAQHVASERLSSFRKPLSASGAHDIPFHRAVLRCLCRHRSKSPDGVLGLHNRASHHFSGVHMYRSTCANHCKASLPLSSDTACPSCRHGQSTRTSVARPVRRQASQYTARCLVRARSCGRACLRSCRLHAVRPAVKDYC
jgi:hypothetical protein